MNPHQHTQNKKKKKKELVLGSTVIRLHLEAQDTIKLYLL